MNKAYVTLHVECNGSSTLIYSPETMEKRFISHLDAKVGDWFEVNDKNNQIIKCVPLCDTRILHGRLEIRTPLTFLSSEKYRNIVGFAPGFGHVGCFIQNKFKKNFMYNAWITYMEFAEDVNIHTIMNLFGVFWIVSNSYCNILSRTELYHDAYLRLSMFVVVKGIVVRSDEFGGEIFNDEFKLCYYKLDNEQPKLAIGTFVKFIPITDFEFRRLAVNVYDIGFRKGIRYLPPCVGSMNIRFIVDNWLLSKKTGLVDIPGFCLKISNENKNLPLLGKPLIIEFNRSFNTFIVPNESNIHSPQQINEFSSLPWKIDDNN